MSVADGVRPAEQRQAEPPASGYAAEPRFDRTPPQDIAAEQSVIGGMLLSKDAIADVVEILRVSDFYRPAHATIFEAVLDLYGRGEPADAVTVAAAMAASGELARVGGAAYLHTLMASVPTAANAAYYARIVSERAILRRLIEAGTRIVQLGFGSASGAGRDVDDLVDLAQQAVYDVTERRVSEDFAVLSELLQPTLDEIEAVGSQGGVMTGVPTGFGDLDRLLNGLHAGQLIIVAGRPGLGKALALDTPLPTPSGWTTMGEVAVGDQVMGADGRPATVTMATGVMRGRPCFEVVFSDGTVIVADAEHRWLTRTRKARRSGGSPRVRTTVELAATVRTPIGDHRANHSIPVAAPLVLPDADLPLPPYALGAWLGCGDESGARYTPDDPEIGLHIEAEGLTVVPASGRSGYRIQGRAARTMHAMGVLGDKHVPVRYLRASRAQRHALLAGLLDSDGCVTRSGRVQFRATSRRLSRDVHELVLGLGYRAALTARPAPVPGGDGPAVYTVTFRTEDDVFRVERKRLLHKERCRAAAPAPANLRYVVDVRPVPSVPVRCIQVDNDDHLFLASRSMIPTHNSTAAMDFARSASVRHNFASAIFSLEMSKVEIVMRLLSAEARVPLHVLRSGQLSDDDWTKLARRMGEISEAPLFVDDTPNMNLMEIRAKARRLKQRHDLKLVVVDYLQLMSSPKRVESRQQEVAELSRGLKLLAKEIDCPVVAVSQLNRGPEQRNDKRPQLSDLRESGCLTAATRVMRADTNVEVTLGELLASGARDIPVWALDERLKYRRSTMTHVFPTGRKPVYLLHLASGKQIEATANHAFLTYGGWRRLDTLAPGDRLAVARHVPPPARLASRPETEVIMLAYLLAGGSFARHQPVRYASGDEENLATVTAAARHFGIEAVRDEGPAARVPALRLSVPFRLARGRRDPVAAWLAEMGLFGRRPSETFVPAPVFGLPKQLVALFLRHLWASGGSIGSLARDLGGGGAAEVSGGRATAEVPGGRGGWMSLTSASRRLLDDVSRLLLRFGISSRVHVDAAAAHDAQYTLDICDRDDQLRFLRGIGIPGRLSQDCAKLAARLEACRDGTTLDAIPRRVWHDVREILTERAAPRGRLACAAATRVGGDALPEHAPAGQRLSRIAAVLDAQDMELLATNDVLWDEVVAVEATGERDVYDATVLGTHNFVANGIATHNSIEQDADVVILLHRDDYYDKESPRAGEADFIVAKHRNGPTDTVTVAAQLHLSRFVDMAIV